MKNNKWFIILKSGKCFYQNFRDNAFYKLDLTLKIGDCVETELIDNEQSYFGNPYCKIVRVYKSENSKQRMLNLICALHCYFDNLYTQSNEYEHLYIFNEINFYLYMYYSYLRDYLQILANNLKKELKIDITNKLQSFLAQTLNLLYNGDDPTYDYKIINKNFKRIKKTYLTKKSTDLEVQNFVHNEWRKSTDKFLSEIAELI